MNTMTVKPNLEGYRKMLSEKMQAILDSGGPKYGTGEEAEFARCKREIAAINAEIERDRDEASRRIAAAKRGDWAAAGNVVVGGGLAAEVADMAGDAAGFANAGEFMQALYRKSRGEGVDERLQALKVGATAMGGSSGVTGGYAVPTQFISQAFEANTTSGEVLLNNADRVTMTSDKMTAPAFVDDNHSTSSPYGIAWSMLAENGAIGDKDVQTRSVNLEAHKAGGIFYASNEWLADSAMAGRLSDIFTRSLRWFVESKFWRGTGTGEPLGVLNAASVLEVAKEAGQAADTICYENVIKMLARCMPGSENRLIWAANRTTVPLLMSMYQAIGTSGVAVWQPSAREGAPDLLMGRPIYFSEHLPKVGDSGDLVLIDPMAYVIGDRQAVVIDSSPHYRFNYDQTTFRAIVRFDGQPALNSLFTPANGDTCGWAVKLAAR